MTCRLLTFSCYDGFDQELREHLMNWRIVEVVFGLMIGLIGIGLTLLIYYGGGRPEASLELRTVSSLPLAAPTGALSERVRVLLDGTEVEQLWLSTYTLSNTGELDIGPGDYGSPIIFWSEEVEIEDVIPGETEPPGIEYRLSTSTSGSLWIEPVLLKRGEVMRFSVLST